MPFLCLLQQIMFILIGYVRLFAPADRDKVAVCHANIAIDNGIDKGRIDGITAVAVKKRVRLDEIQNLMKSEVTGIGSCLRSHENVRAFPVGFDIHNVIFPNAYNLVRGLDG